MSDKFIIVYKMKNTDAIEGYILDGELEDAIEFATEGNVHFDYGRRGVQIYKVNEPVFEKMERD
jgi:hypothetical protein